MKKFILLVSATISLFAFKIFDSNYLSLNKPITLNEALQQLSKINHKKYILENNIDFTIPKEDNNYRVYDIETLNKNFLKHKIPYIIKVDRIENNKIYLKVFKKDKVNGYYVKGIRLNNLTVKKALKELNKQHYVQYVYTGADFPIPNNANIVVKNWKGLQDYLDATSYKSIKLYKTIDTNKDGVVDLIVLKAKYNAIPYKLTTKEAVIHHLNEAIKASKKIKNSDFAKEMFEQEMKENISAIKGLK